MPTTLQPIRTPLAYNQKLLTVLKSPEEHSVIAICLFENNYLKSNT